MSGYHSTQLRCCVLQVLYALDAKVDSMVSMATGEGRGATASPTEVWWESLSHRPPFKYMVSAYQQAHDAVVQTPIYTKCAREHACLLGAWCCCYTDASCHV